MTESTGQNLNTEQIDDLLEQAGMSVAESDFDAALPLLRKAKQYGDESQREMADAYLQMIDELFPSDAQAELPQDPISSEEIIDEVVEQDIADDFKAEEAIFAETVIEKTPTIEEPQPVKEPAVEQQQEAEAQETKPKPPRQHDEVVVYSENKPTPKVPPTSSEQQPWRTGTLEYAEHHEHNIALEQAAKMIEGGEFEVAEDLLNTVIKSGDQNQRSQAQAHMEQISSRRLLPEKTDFSNEKESRSTKQADRIVKITDVGMSAEDIAEMDLALSQSELLVADGENDLARSFLETILLDGDEEHRQIAQQLLYKVEQAEANAKLRESTDAETQPTDTIIEPNYQHGIDLLDPVTALSGGVSLSVDDQSTAMPAQGSGLQNVQYRQGFRVGGIGLMIRYIDGSSLVDLPNFYSMPNAPEWFRGVANLHGSIIPGFDLKNLFGLAEKEGRYSPMFLVLGHDDDRTGIVVDALPQRLSWTAEQESDSNTAPEFLRPYVKQACIINDELWFDLDSSGLCQALEEML